METIRGHAPHCVLDRDHLGSCLPATIDDLAPDADGVEEPVNSAVPPPLEVLIARGLRPCAMNDGAVSEHDLARAREAIAAFRWVLDDDPDRMLELGWQRWPRPSTRRGGFIR